MEGRIAGPEPRSPERERHRSPCETLATIDLTGGDINLLTGSRPDILPTFATHEHICGIYAVANARERKALQTGAAESVKRTKPNRNGKSAGSLEFKATWHPPG